MIPKRTLCISDIHGQYEMFKKLLNKVQFNPAEDKLILLGDYCDRGPKSKEVIELVSLHVNEHGAIALRGNHEELFLNFLDGSDGHIFFFNGGEATVRSYLHPYKDGLIHGLYPEIRRFINEKYKHHVDFIRGLPYYHEDEHHIYVHAGINPYYADWKNTPKNEMLWIRERFIECPLDDIEKTVVFGHTPTLHIHKKMDVWFGEGKIGIDGGAAAGIQLNCLVIQDKRYETVSVVREDLVEV